MGGRARNKITRGALALACAFPAIAIGSCSRSVKLSVIDPAQLVALPTSGGHASALRVIRSDSVATLDDGLLALAGDSIRIYSRAEPPGATLRATQPAIYSFRRAAPSVRVTGFVPAGLHWRPWEGSLRGTGDSLEFLSPEVRAHGLRRGARAETLTVPARAIARVDLEQTDVVHTIVVATLLIAVVLGMSAFAYAAAMSMN
jgi:hypothetical protein